MTANNEAFEKFISELDFQDIAHDTESIRNLYKRAWQAATTEANKRIAVLESEVAELKEKLKYSEYASDAEFRFADKLSDQVTELQASNNRLRETLEEAMNDTSGWYDKAKGALSATPAESLQAFLNEVIERCANVCESINQYTQFQTVEDYKLANEAARNIRALKLEGTK